MIRPLVCAIALVAAAPVLAQESETLAAAERLIEVTHVGQQLEQSFVTMTPFMAKSAMAQLAATDSTRAMFEDLTKNDYARKQKLEAILGEEFLAAMRAQLPRFKREYAREYAAQFSKAELDALTAFFSGGAGAKYIAATPALQAKLSATGQRIGMEVGMIAMPKALQRAKAELGDAKP